MTFKVSDNKYGRPHPSDSWLLFLLLVACGYSKYSTQCRTIRLPAFRGTTSVQTAQTSAKVCVLL